MNIKKPTKKMAKMIKLAEREILEWQKFLKECKKRIK